MDQNLANFNWNHQTRLDTVGQQAITEYQKPTRVNYFNFICTSFSSVAHFPSLHSSIYIHCSLPLQSLFPPLPLQSPIAKVNQIVCKHIL